MISNGNDAREWLRDWGERAFYPWPSGAPTRCERLATDLEWSAKLCRPGQQRDGIEEAARVLREALEVRCSG